MIFLHHCHTQKIMEDNLDIKKITYKQKKSHFLLSKFLLFPSNFKLIYKFFYTINPDEVRTLTQLRVWRDWWGGMFDPALLTRANTLFWPSTRDSRLHWQPRCRPTQNCWRGIVLPVLTGCYFLTAAVRQRAKLRLGIGSGPGTWTTHVNKAGSSCLVLLTGLSVTSYSTAVLAWPGSLWHLQLGETWANLSGKHHEPVCACAPMDGD